MNNNENIAGDYMPNRINQKKPENCAFSGFRLHKQQMSYWSDYQ